MNNPEKLTQVDSLQSVIDSLTLIAEKPVIENPEIIDLYKLLLEQENSNHNYFITAIFGITLLIIGASWYWNKVGADKFIEHEVTKQMKEKDNEWEKEIKKISDKTFDKKLKEVDRTILSLEADLYRTIAHILENNKSHSSSIKFLAKTMINSLS